MRNPFTSMQTAHTHPVRHALITSTLAMTLAAGVMTGPAAAQDGTGAATPTPPSACEIIPATASFGDDTAATEVATPMASPATGLASTPSASPVTDAGATPVTEEATVDPLTRDLEASATAIAGCLSDTNFDTLVDITGELYRGQLIGLSEPLNAGDFTTLASTLPASAYQILSVEDATFTDESSATAVVTYEVAHQLRKSTWEFSLQEVRGEQAWVLESETAMAPELPANTATIEVTVQDNAYVLKDETVSGPSVALSATNNDQVDHEMLVLRLEGDTTTKTLLQSPGPSLPEGVTFIGQATVPAGGSGTLLLSGLQPGEYTIVDLLPNAEGLPNLMGGMEITFTVE
jgi:hypothetical protein